MIQKYLSLQFPYLAFERSICLQKQGMMKFDEAKWKDVTYFG